MGGDAPRKTSSESHRHHRAILCKPHEAPAEAHHAFAIREATLCMSRSCQLARASFTVTDTTNEVQPSMHIVPELTGWLQDGTRCASMFDQTVLCP